MYQSLTPNLIVNDVSKAAHFYTHILEFEYVSSVNSDGETLTEDHEIHQLIWTLLQKDNIHIMLQKKDTILFDIPDIQNLNQNYNVIFITASNVQKIYNQIKDKVEIVKDIYETFYGTKEFIIKDPYNTFIFYAQHEEE